MALSKNQDINFSPLKEKLFRRLYHAFVKAGLYSPRLQRADLPHIVPDIEHHKYTLLHLRISSLFIVFLARIFCLSLTIIILSRSMDVQLEYQKIYVNYFKSL